MTTTKNSDIVSAAVARVNERPEEGLKLAKKLSEAQFGPQLKKSLLDLCREFDAIDLSECNRRLEASEKFDADCDDAMERREFLGEQFRARLGDEWGDFERRHEAFVRQFPRLTQAAEQVVVGMIHDAAEFITSHIQGPDSLDESLIRRHAKRLTTLTN